MESRAAEDAPMALMLEQEETVKATIGWFRLAGGGAQGKPVRDQVLWRV